MIIFFEYLNSRLDCLGKSPNLSGYPFELQNHGHYLPIIHNQRTQLPQQTDGYTFRDVAAMGLALFLNLRIGKGHPWVFFSLIFTTP